MTITTSHSAASTYTESTASMQTDPEARHHGGAASESSSPQSFPLEAARCATHPSALEWVPDREIRVVPDEMTALCRRCPGRQNCLLWALAGREKGYWAGTTEADRDTMLRIGQNDVDTADWLQDLARRDTASVMHPAGEGSLRWYRNKCRCTECKSANALARARERERRAHRA